MKVVLDLQVSAHEFYSIVLQSIIEDVKKTTNKRIHCSQIKKGMNYRKTITNRFCGNADVLVKVLECNLDVSYAAAFISNIDVTYVRYCVENIHEDGTISASYQELHSFNPSKTNLDFLQQNNEKCSKWKTGNTILKKIEKKIIQNREA